MSIFKTMNGRENEFVKSIEEDSYKNKVVVFHHRLSLPLYKVYRNDEGKAYMVDNNIGPIDQIIILYPFMKTYMSVELRYVGGCLALVITLPDKDYGFTYSIHDTTIVID